MSNKAVLLSVQPKWCELIATGKKTIEIRKTKPKIKVPFKAYIYCTKDRNNHFWTGKRYSYTDEHSHNAFDKDGNGKVIAEKEFTLDDFSWEHLFTRDFQTYGIYDNDDQQTVYLQASALEVLNTVIQALNAYRRAYLVSQKANKALWWQMIQLLPQSYNQRATVQMNYEVLANMYHSRKNHKLDEWRKFCEWVGGLPYSVIITGNSDNA